MVKKILLTVASLSSLNAHAGEFLVRCQGRFFKGAVTEELSPAPVMAKAQLISLLKGANLEEISFGEANEAAQNGTPVTACAQVARWTETIGPDDRARASLSEDGTVQLAGFESWTER